MLALSIISALSIATCTATKLYGSSYDGNITTVNVSVSKPAGAGNESSLVFQTVARNTGCSPGPSWLQLHKGTLYCADEGNTTPNSSIVASFRTTVNGTLIPLSKVTTLNGNVNSAISGNGSVMALAE